MHLTKYIIYRVSILLYEKNQQVYKSFKSDGWEIASIVINSRLTSKVDFGYTVFQNVEWPNKVWTSQSLPFQCERDEKDIE